MAEVGLLGNQIEMIPSIPTSTYQSLNSAFRQLPKELLSDVVDFLEPDWIEVIKLGHYQYRVQKALNIYQTGNCSLGYAAKKMGLDKQALVVEAKARGIEPFVDENMVIEEIGADLVKELNLA